MCTVFVLDFWSFLGMRGVFVFASKSSCFCCLGFLFPPTAKMTPGFIIRGWLVGWSIYFSFEISRFDLRYLRI